MCLCSTIRLPSISTNQYPIRPAMEENLTGKLSYQRFHEHPLDPPSECITSFSPDGHRVAVGNVTSGVLKVLDTESGKTVVTILNTTKLCSLVWPSLTFNGIVCGYEDGLICIFRLLKSVSCEVCQLVELTPLHRVRLLFTDFPDMKIRLSRFSLMMKEYWHQELRMK